MSFKDIIDVKQFFDKTLTNILGEAKKKLSYYTSFVKFC